MYDLKKPLLSMPSGNVVSCNDAKYDFRHHLIAACKLGTFEENLANDKVTRLNLSVAEGQGELDFIKLSDDIFIIVDKATFFHEKGFKFMDSEWTRFHFRLEADTTLLFEGLGQADLKGPLCSIMHHPEGMVEAEWYNETTPNGWITIFCSRTYLLELLEYDTESLPKALSHYLNSGRPEWIFDVLPLTATMARCIHDIPEIPYTTHLGQIHLEAKVIELICMFLHNLSEDGNKHSLPILLRNQDVDRLHEARRILTKSYIDPPSMVELSRGVGLNRKKLTYGFKHLFQQTVSEFIYQQKMMTANDLLNNSEMAIEQIAQSVGYDHAGNFSTAFKRYFGIPPRRRKNKGISSN